MTENGSKTIENYPSYPWHTAVLFCLVTTPSRALWIVACGLDLGTEDRAMRNQLFPEVEITLIDGVRKLDYYGIR